MKKRWLTTLRKFFGTRLILELTCCFLIGILFFMGGRALAAGPPLPVNNPSADSGGSKANTAEDEDFAGTAFTEYGEFNQTEDEEEEARFFQYGRFYGVSLGVGTQFVGGNRGALWKGGFPTVDLKVHYWFDFNFALDLNILVTSHYFDSTVDRFGHVDVNMLHAGIDIKYYFPVKNLSAPITFANPYLSVGFGSYTKTQNSNTQQTQSQDTSVGFLFGGGLEFTLSPRRTFFELEGKVHIVTFQDTFTTIFQPTLQDLTGHFYTITGSVLFTW